jgi:hypothetical protein
MRARVYLQGHDKSVWRNVRAERTGNGRAGRAGRLNIMGAQVREEFKRRLVSRVCFDCSRLGGGQAALRRLGDKMRSSDKERHTAVKLVRDPVAMENISLL